MSPKPAILDHATTLADATRCRILQLLEDQELMVSELCQVMQLPQSTVSRHLKVLSDGGWLDSRRDGTSRLYQMKVANGDTGAAAELWQLISRQTAQTTVSRQDRARLEGVLAARRGRSQEFFASANEWDRLRDELFGARFDLHALLGLLDPAWVVGDLGCGTGRLSEALAPFVREVVAVDGSAAMLEAARERLKPHENVRLRGGDLEELPIEEGSLDAATLILALHHTSKPRRVLAEARRTLKPGGRLLLVDMLPHDREEYRRDMGHIWLGFSEEQIRRALEAAGYADCRLRTLPADPEARGPALFVATASA